MSQSDTPEAAVLAVVNAVIRATAGKDAPGLAGLYTQDNVMFILEPPLQFTAQNRPGEPGLQEWFDSWDGPLTYEAAEIHVAASHDLAFSYALLHMAGRKRDGEVSDLWFRETLCFRKENGAWKILHQHQSVPYYMDSKLAALDLKPEG